MVKKIIAGIVILVLCSVGGYVWVQQSVVTVQTEAVSVGDIERFLTETGTVTAEQKAVVPSTGTGVVTALHAEEGIEVKAGDLLLTYDVAEANLRVSSMTVQKEGLERQLAEARAEASRQELLWHEGAISDRSYQQYTNAAESLETEIAVLEYNIAAARKANGNGRVTAPISGLVVAQSIEKGNLVTTGQTVMELADLSRLYLKADVIAEDAEKIATGDLVRVYAADGQQLPLQGTVRKIGLQAKETVSALGIVQKRVTVEIALDASDKQLRLGNDLELEIQTDLHQQVLTVPNEAVFKMDGISYVFVAEEGKAVLRSFTAGLEGQLSTEVVDGLEEGVQVILSPENALEDGSRIKIEQ